ncbi:MAG: dihydrolipoyl dehydrogenase [Prevotellaceae bacterium]|nr:dihydrolipoyl dehydrogenase [Prevotellaceae bacterium]MDD6008519.1 dihydrolipoyl dehydrogenase [Prevotellaceae bacterium]
MKSDIIIIGSGPGGYRTAAYAAAKGKTVTIFEEGPLGGTCLNVGCIPTKTFARSAEAAGEMRNAAQLGLKAIEPEFSLADIVARKDAIVDQLRQAIAGVLSAPGITLVNAKAEFVDDHTVEAAGERYTADNIIIASGSSHKSLRIEALDESMLLTSDTLLSLTEFPRRLVIVGAGVIGMEFASIFRQLGAEVTVVEFLKECIPALDADVAKRLRKVLEKQGVEFYMQSAVKSIANGCVTFERKGKEQSIEADKVLVAVGRKPNVEGFALEKTSIKYDARGIEVDDDMLTNVPGVYAIGDVNARMMLAHAATMQGLHVVNTIVGVKDDIRLDIMPAAIFTNPEAACVGKTEEQLKADGVDIEVRKKNYRTNGRALAMAEPEGMIKLVADKNSGEILSCHAYGAHSADIVQEISALMCKHTTVQQLHEMVHIHPTINEMLQEI